MTKKTVITYKYDDKGNIVEKTETITEYIENYVPYYPTPSNPYFPKDIYYKFPKEPQYYDTTITCTSGMNDKIKTSDCVNKVVDSINTSLNKSCGAYYGI